MKRPWLFDLDGVFANFNRGLLDQLDPNRRVVKNDDPRVFPETWWWPADLGLQTGDHFVELDWAFYAGLQPYEGVREIAEALLTYDQPTYIVTARTGDGIQAVTELWVRRHLVTRVPVLTHAAHKGCIAAGLQAALAVDDYPGFCTQYADAGVDRVLLIDRPYNRAFHDPRVTRVSLEQLVEEVRR